MSHRNYSCGMDGTTRMSRAWVKPDTARTGTPETHPALFYTPTDGILRIVLVSSSINSPLRTSKRDESITAARASQRAPPSFPQHRAKPLKQTYKERAKERHM